MSKVLIIDCCWSCPSCHAVGDWPGKCERMDKSIGKPKEMIPDWRPLPKTPQPLLDVVFAPDAGVDEGSYMMGYNECIDVMMGKLKDD